METYYSDNISEIALALIEIHKQMAPATKDAKNPFIGNNYATLNSVMVSCRDILLDHGIWLTQLPVPAPIGLGPGYLGLMTKLTHVESCQWQSYLIIIPLPKADPQGMGSAITYARRFALTAMLGMITEDDAEAVKLPIQRTKRGNTPQNSKANGKQARQQRQTEPEYDKQAQTLPDLEGVAYQCAAFQDRRQRIVASSNNRPQKEMLRRAGFIWNAQRKIW